MSEPTHAAEKQKIIPLEMVWPWDDPKKDIVSCANVLYNMPCCQVWLKFSKTIIFEERENLLCCSSDNRLSADQVFILLANVSQMYYLLTLRKLAHLQSTVF